MFRSVSQPLEVIPSQLPQPASQAPIAHIPDMHRDAACGYEHAVPQLPHAVIEPRSVSQPSAGTPLQLPQPAVQAPSAHTPAVQLDVALAK